MGHNGPQMVWCYCPVLSSPRALGVSPFGQMRPLNSSWTKVGKEVRLKAMKVTIWKSDLQLSAESLVGEDLDKKSGSEDTADWWPFLNIFIMIYHWSCLDIIQTWRIWLKTILSRWLHWIPQVLHRELFTLTLQALEVRICQTCWKLMGQNLRPKIHEAISRMGIQF